MNLKGLVGAAAVMAAAATGAHASNLLVNGSFETGDLSGWYNTGNSDHTFVTPGFGGYGPQDGSYFVAFGAVGGDYGLNQGFADVAGQTYTVSYYVAGNGTGFSDVNAYIDGTLEQTIGSPVPAQPYTRYSFTFVGTGADLLTLGLRNDPSYDALDNVSISAGGVPEPATWAVMLLGILGVGAQLRMRRKSALATA